MTDDGNAPTIPDTAMPTHGGARPSGSSVRSPDERYVLQTLLGSGGMGEVWLAHDVRVDRDIAIKLMRGTGNPDAVARFLREARVQGRLEHPSVVPVHDLGGADDAPYFAMKRLTGTTLAEVIEGKDPVWTREKLLARFVDICLAVEFAHQRGVIHRDLKPANIMLGDFGEAYVLDWGLARIASTEERAIETRDLRGDSAAGHTQAGAMLGTPGYMAPEQMRGEPVDARTDVFALGCILYEILAGTPAIPRDKTFELTLTASCYRPSERVADLPPELDDACARATAADRAKRHASARELADAVQRFLDGDRDVERRRTLAAEHAARALAVFTVDTEQTRSEAMREAGAAIAIDPSNTDAQQLLAKLLLTPPETIPPAVREKVADERRLATRTVLRAGRQGYLLFFLVTPLIKLLGVPVLWPIVTLEVLIAFQIAGLTVAIYMHDVRAWTISVLVAVHSVLLGFIGILVGSLLVLPVIIFGTLPIFLLIPTLHIPKTIAALHALVLAVPFALELTNVVPPSFHLDGDKLVIQPTTVHLAPAALIAILFGVVVVQLVANTFILTSQRHDQERREVQVHLQTWQLGRLVRTDEA
jgi:serine/threonine-protein kinase